MGGKPKLTDHQKREAISRRDHGEETLAEIGHSYNVSGWTISRWGMSPFPENFTRLYQGEKFLRAKSVEAFEAAHDLAMHAEVIAADMDLIDYFARHYINETDDQLTIQLLGIRLFNGAASALNLFLSGYYQTSALQRRDLLLL